MSPSRRDFNRLIATLLATGAAGCSNAGIEDTPISTPDNTTPVETETPLPDHQCITPPEEPSPDPVFKEAYGEVVLTDDNPENQYCIWTVESDECFELSYEARVTGSNDGRLDILAVPDDEKEEYVDKLHVESTGIVEKRIEKARDDTIQINDFIEPLTREGVTNREYQQVLSTKSAVLQPGQYHLIFDHTDIGGTRQRIL